MKNEIMTPVSRRWTAGLFCLTVLFTWAMANDVRGQSSFTWNGGSGTAGNWSDGNNWGGSGPANPQAFLNFNGATRTSSTNDFSSGGPGYQIYFKSGASAFNLYGNSIFFYDFGGGANDPNIQNEGASPTQTINFPVANGNNNGTFHILNINVNTGTSQGPLTFNGGVSSADANQALRVVNIYGPSAIGFNGIISDFDSTHKLALSQLGSGTTTLTASNTFTGDMTVNAGTLVLATNSALANGGNFIRLGDTAATGNGANLNLNGGNNLSTSINVRSGSSGTKIIANTSGTTGNASFLGSLFLDADVTTVANANGTNIFSNTTLDLKNQTLTISGTGATIISGTLINSTGSGKIVTATSAGPLTLSGANSYTGGTTLGSSAAININNATVLGTGTFTVGGNGTFDNTSGASVTNANNNALTLSGGSPVFTGTANLNFGNGIVTISGANRTLTVNANTLTLGGGITDAGGARQLTKAGAGTLVLGGASGIWTGGFVMSAGIVQANANNVFGTGTVTMNTSSTQTKLLLNGVIITNTMTLSSTNPGSAQGVIQCVDNTSSTNSGIVTFTTNTVSGGNLYGPTTSGLLTMAGAINVTSPGTLLLVRDGRVRFSGGGSYTNMDIRSSTSSLGANNGLATTTVVDIGGNASTTVPAVLDLNGFNQTLAGLKNNVTPANLAWVTNSSATASTLTLAVSNLFTYGGSIIGNLAVTVVGGTQVFSNSAAGNGIYAYTGDTTITNGTLKLGAANLLPNGAGKGNMNVTNTGILDLNTFSQTINGLAGSGTVDSVAGGTPTLTVGGNNISSTFSGLIKNTAGSLALTKSGSGTLTLTGTSNTFSGAINIGISATGTRIGAILAAANQAVGTGLITVGPGGNDATAELLLSNSISINNPILIPQRSGYLPAIESISGNNTNSSVISLTSGGSFAIIQSDAGTLTIGTGGSAAISNSVTGGTRLIILSGAGNGNVAGNIVDVGTAVMGVTKDGAGTWTLSGANAYSGDTRITNGTLTVNNTAALQNSSVDMNAADSGTLNLNNLSATLGGLKGSRALALGTGTVSIGNNGVANTYSGSLTGSALAKVGAGTWTLTGTNTFAGTTTVNAGELFGLTGSSLSNSVVTVNSGATNGVLLAATNGQWACGGLTYAAGTTYADFNFNGLVPSTTVAPIFVNGTVTFTVQPTVIVRSAGATIAPGTYPLIKYTGAAPGAVPTTLILPTGVTATLVNNTGNKSIDLNVTVGNQIYWAVGSGTWDINTTANWKNTSGSAVNYLDGEAVLLDDNATASPTISLGVTVTPASITVSNVARAYTISPTAPAGVLTGSGALVKNGSGTLTIATTNTTYAGAITLNGGTLALGSSASIGTGVITMNDGTTFRMAASGSQSVFPGNNILVSTGANATISSAVTGNGYSGTVSSGDSNSIVTIVNGGGSVNFSASNIKQLGSGFNGTVKVVSGATLDHRGTISGTGDGGDNATYQIDGTITTKNAGNLALGALTGSGTLTGGGALTYTIGAKNISTTFAGVIGGGAAGSGNVVTIMKTGSGTLTLSGTNTYVGATTISAGGLIGVVGGSCSNTAITVSAVATNGVSVTVPGNQWACSNLTYATGSYVSFAFGANTPSTTVAPLLVQNGVTISGTLNIIISGGSTTIPVGTYPLIKYTNTLSGTVPPNPFSLPAYVSGIITNDTANKVIALIVTNVVTPTLVWSAGNGTWETNSINWTNTFLSFSTNWTDGNVAQFDDTAVGAGPFTVTLTNNVNPIGVLFTNNAKNYTLTGSGSITGSGTLTKAGSGMLVLATTNTSTGGIVVSGGTLQGTSGTLLGSIVNSAALVFDQSVSGSNNAVISGTGTLTKQNSGTLALGGNNTYTGKTFVTAGTLAISAGANVGGTPGGATPDQLTINGATLLATNGAATITLPTNAGLTVTNTATIDVGAGITLDYPAGQGIAGAGTLVKNGAGVFQTDESAASSTYTNLILNSGTFAFNKSSGGLGAGLLTINGGVLRTSTSTPRSPNNPAILVNGDCTFGSAASGAITFVNGGTWTLANGTRTITVDTITASLGGVVNDGGNNYGLTKAGSGVLVLTAADTYTGPTLISAGALKLANNLGAGTNAITAAGTLQIANGITVSNSFTATQTFESMDVPDVSAIGTFTGTAGAVGGSSNFRFMASGAGATLVFSNATVNTGSKSLFATRGNIVYAGNSAISSTTASLIGRSAGNPASLVVKDNAVCNFTAGFALGNSGGINSSVAFTIQDSASLTTGTSGFDFLGTTVASSSASLNGGTLAVGALFKTAATAETLSLNGGTIKANASSATFFPSLTGLTANVSTGGAVFNDNSFNITIAQPLLHDSTLGATADGGLTKSGAGVTTLSGVSTYSGPTTVNAGTLFVSGTLGTNVVTVNTNTILSGTGVLNGATTVALGGTVQSGSGGGNIATLTISNSLTLGGNAQFNLNRTNAQNANLIAGLTTVSYGGTLTVTNVGDALQSGDTFTLFAAGSYTGSFANITLPPLTGVLIWNTNNLAVNGTISVILGISPTTLTLTSSSNPAGYLDTLTFTAMLAPTNATGNVTFYNGATPFSTNALTLGVATSGSISTLARGTNTITATYLGDMNYFGSTNSLAQIVTNHPPVVANVNYYRNAGISTLRITIADLLTNVTDVDSDTVTLTGTGTSTNGVSLFNGSGFLLYQNTNNVNDQFTYTVDDANGGSTTGNVNVVVQPFATGQNASIVVSGSTATVGFFGIPGYNYGVQRSTNLTAWATILTTNAPSNGAFQWTDDFSDLGVVPGSAYYRLQWNP